MNNNTIFRYTHYSIEAYLGTYDEDDYVFLGSLFHHDKDVVNRWRLNYIKKYGSDVRFHLVKTEVSEIVYYRTSNSY